MTAAHALAWARPDNRVWIAGASLAMALHGVAVTAWLIARHPADSPLPPPAPMIVDLVSLAAAPVPDQVPPPAPVAQPPLPERVETPPEIIEPPPAVKPAVVIERPKPKPKPRRPRPAVAPPPVAPPPPPAAAMAAPPTMAPPAPPNNAARTARNLWKARLLAHLERYKRYPLECRRRHEEGVVLLRFRIAPDGRVLASRIERGVAAQALNQAVMDMIARADPVPAPPPELVDGSIELTVPVNFTLRR